MSNQEQNNVKQQQQQQQKTYLDLSVKQHHKHNQSNKDNKRREETTHQYLFIQFRQIYHTYGGESNFSIQYDESDTKKLQEISLQAHKDRTLISTHVTLAYNEC